MPIVKVGINILDKNLDISCGPPVWYRFDHFITADDLYPPMRAAVTQA